MDFRQLEYILAVCDNKTLTKASEEVFISPSALSQSIAGNSL
jgi:DNA-binding transcriptional LysR family regulator